MECLKRQIISSATLVKDGNCDIAIKEANDFLDGDLKAKLEHFFKDSNLKEGFEIPPTLVAMPIYSILARNLNNNDIYKSIKQDSIQKARIIKESLKKEMYTQNKETLLKFGIYCAAFGNVIDYGAQLKFDLEKERDSLFSMKFKYFDIESFKEKLEYAKNLLYIGDNAGENELDEILIEVLQRLNPKLEITYFTRGQSIINDITMKDLQDSNSNLFNICSVVDSGVGTPGFIPDLSSAEAYEIYNKADLILSKGMGNFESLESLNNFKTFFLFKVKCSVVGNYLNADIGNFVFLDSNKYKECYVD